ncbi:tetratricopeptide repeat protein [Amycolatopsis alkalitolerans]|uniref:tetratricopeptide repeat protein n=1 Tax=Amycolatopsis alkalitolerans TaxID=2547244 RepID=UPI001358D262|nr:tetratricopeptide repeat protein [Amycolatopsis alkalitolerans]
MPADSTLRRGADQGPALVAALGIYKARFHSGDWAGAEAVLREFIAGYDPTSAPFRSGLLSARRELAHVRLHRGEYEEAVGELREIAAECRQRWGEVSLHCIIAHSVLGEALSVAGYSDEAVTVQRQVVGRIGGVPGISSKQSDFARVLLASRLIKAGRVDEAEQELVGVVPTLEATATEAALTLRSVLAELTTKQGRHQDAARQWAELLPAYAERHVGVA